MSARYYSDHPDFAGEVDHRALIERLCDEYSGDGWALSTSSKTLAYVLRLCPADVRVGAWTKPAAPSSSRRARVAWEPVIFHGGRPRPDDAPTLLDWVHAAPLRAYPNAVVGTKPPAFCAWVFECLGAELGDTLDDLYPGSGAVARAWSVWQASRLEERRDGTSVVGVGDVAGDASSSARWERDARRRRGATPGKDSASAEFDAVAAGGL